MILTPDHERRINGMLAQLDQTLGNLDRFSGDFLQGLQIWLEWAEHFEQVADALRRRSDKLATVRRRMLIEAAAIDRLLKRLA